MTPDGDQIRVRVEGGDPFTVVRDAVALFDVIHTLENLWPETVPVAA